MSKHSDIFARYGTGRGDQPPIKKCRVCEKPLKPDSRFDTCFECGQTRKKSDAGGPVGGLPPDYLKTGYFDDKDQLREGIYKDDAKLVAGILANNKMSANSLRAFYNKLKAIESKYKTSGNNFDLIRPTLFAFERDVAYQVSRQVVPEDFRTFINANAELAAKGPKEFKGFVEHFLSVLAYFKDFSKSS